MGRFLDARRLLENHLHTVLLVHLLEGFLALQDLLLINPMKVLHLLAPLVLLAQETLVLCNLIFTLFLLIPKLHLQLPGLFVLHLFDSGETLPVVHLVRIKALRAHLEGLLADVDYLLRLLYHFEQVVLGFFLHALHLRRVDLIEVL